MMNDATLSRNFKALAHPRRAMIFRILSLRPEQGSSLDSLLGATRLSPSSLVHHLREMERCGLLARHRRGVNVVYAVRPGEFTAALGSAMRIADTAQARRRNAA